MRNARYTFLTLVFVVLPDSLQWRQHDQFTDKKLRVHYHLFTNTVSNDKLKKKRKREIYRLVVRVDK